MFSYLYLALSFIFSIWIMLDIGFYTKPYGIVLLFGWIVLLYLICFVLHIVVFALFGLTINLKRLPAKIDNIYRKIGFDTLKVFLDTLHIHAHVTGMELVPEGKFMLVSNHRSCFDPMVQLLLFKKQKLAFVSKQENMQIPFVGRYMAAIGCIPLNRENTKEALKSINLAAEYITSGKANIGIYPEGWVNKSDEPLLPFRNGAFRIAKKADAPILVTTIRGTEQVKRRFIFRRTHVYVNILGIIPAEELKRMKTAELGNRVEKMMYEDLKNN